jgi:hypothetical protein
MGVGAAFWGPFPTLPQDFRRDSLLFPVFNAWAGTRVGYTHLESGVMSYECMRMWSLSRSVAVAVM